MLAVNGQDINPASYAALSSMVQMSQKPRTILGKSREFKLSQVDRTMKNIILMY